jgi:hypothetical protein
MKLSYGVVWREGTLPLATGRLDLGPRRLKLDGLADSHPVARDIGYESLTAVRVGRSSSDRIDGQPTVVLERRTGLPITIAAVAQPSIVGEIAERLTALQLGASRRTVFVVPLRDGSQDAVRDLVAAGPPFDPEEAPGLDRHEVFLTANEAVFLFDSPLGAAALEALLTEPELWRAANAWREHLAGPPRIAENVYAWERPAAGPDPTVLPPGLRNGH